MTAPMQTTQEVLISSLSARVKSIVKAYGISSLSLNHGMVIDKEYDDFMRESRRKYHDYKAENYYTTDTQDGVDIKLLPSVFGIVEPYPETIVFCDQKTTAQEYKGLSKVGRRKDGTALFLLARWRGMVKRALGYSRTDTGTGKRPYPRSEQRHAERTRNAR